MTKKQKLEQLQKLVEELGLKTANNVRKERNIPYYKAVTTLEGITIDNVRYVVTK
jgi:adenylate cyclase class IV